ncbi:gibberellin 2-beta-dioxygenase [Musa troglodytarum]|uniref:Gibberellin 2-beta-dioxygenase n=1 Tax=Musa troglodytarum TaxID=320322 RepID=A0A9E7G3F4_9LILI|nr:gibberellin 2-beta-dioxygenase [Musa troglodytarum]
MWREQIKLFELPFEKKARSTLLNDSYRWGTPTATSLQQFSWSEAFHVPIAKISEKGSCHGEFSSLRDAMEKLAAAMSELATTLAGALAESLGYDSWGFPESCNKSTCFLRLNHYPPCPFSSDIFGLMPHTDSDFLTILNQDQAWSNDVYKSVEHKVMINSKRDRYSIAYFLCPSYESTIGSCKKPSIYKDFTFGEYRKQVQEDVKTTGQKIGLPRFLLQNISL